MLTRSEVGCISVSLSIDGEESREGMRCRLFLFDSTVPILHIADPILLTSLVYAFFFLTDVLKREN